MILWEPASVTPKPIPPSWRKVFAVATVVLLILAATADIWLAALDHSLIPYTRPAEAAAERVDR